MRKTYLYVAGAVGVGVLVWLLTRKSSSPGAVAGTVTSGSQGLTIDTNVLSPTFGQPITN